MKDLSLLTVKRIFEMKKAGKLLCDVFQSLAQVYQFIDADSTKKKNNTFTLPIHSNLLKRGCKICPNFCNQKMSNRLRMIVIPILKLKVSLLIQIHLRIKNLRPKK